MVILVSNDDGIMAEGIHRLAAALKEKGDVYVFAPDKQRSASSHALSVHDKVTIKKIDAADFPEAKAAWSMSGTPADCVKLGINVLVNKGIVPDIIYTGINHGANLGTDTMYSGTVSAAAEGVFAGFPAVAVSVCDHAPKYFDVACKLAVDLFEKSLGTKGRGSVVSINAPNIPNDEVKGVRVARLGSVHYQETFEVTKVDNEQEAEVYEYVGTPILAPNQTDDMDTKLTHDGYATVSMIKYDLNDYEGMEELKSWEIEL